MIRKRRYPGNIFSIIMILLLTAAIMLSTVNISAEVSNVSEAINSSEWIGFVEEKMAQDNVPGLIVTAVNGNEREYRGFGYSNTAENTAYTETTPFCIGSCSKAFTALSILILLEEGRLSIDDSVSDYIPWWHVTYKGSDADVKIWHLLAHCSGIPNSTMMKIPTGTDDAMFEQTVRIAENLELVREPGSEFEYCNLGYDILAYITQTVIGMPFEDFMKQEVFIPIGMTHSGYGIPTTQGYNRSFGKTVEFKSSFRGCYGDGELISTAEDMALWIDAQLGHLELPEKLSNAIKASHEPTDKKAGKTDLDYQFGWIINNGTLFHLGTVPTFSTMLILDVEKDIGICANSNLWCNIPDYAANSLYQTMNGEPINREMLNAPDTTKLIDTISSSAIIINTILIFITIILFATQKKRLAKRQTDMKKDRSKLCIRLILLALAMLLLIMLPTIIGTIAGYGRFYYKMIAIWMPYTLLISFATVGVLLIMLAVTSISRYLIRKKNA